jgi:hypothetical protein
MPRLCFKKRFFDAILGGRKTSTIRRWKSCRISPGDRIFSPHLGWLSILSCEKIELDELDESDAKADGLDSLADLHKVLDRIYPTPRDHVKQWYRLTFSIRPLGEGLKWTDIRTKKGNSIRSDKKRVPKRMIKGEARLGRKARMLLVHQVRVELDKAVRQSRSLATL